MNFINGKVVVKENDYCDDNPVKGKKYFFTNDECRTLLDCHEKGLTSFKLQGIITDDYTFEDSKGYRWKHIIEARPIVFDKYAKVGEEYYFTDHDVVRQPDLIGKIIKYADLLKLRHIHKGRMHPFQVGRSWKHVIRGI